MEQLKLNMIPNGVNPVFHASQYDKGRQIRFVLDETLSGAEVTVSYRAKDGTEYGNVQMSISGNTITDTIPEEVLTDYGIIEGEVKIDGIGSLNFFVEVEKDAYDGGVITTQTARGAIATFETNIETAFVSLKSEINPVQDLHGYSKPWSGGGGKNKLNCTATTETKNGVTLTVVKNSANQVTQINVSGTATAGVSFTLGTATIEAGTYVLNGYTGGSSVGTKYINYSGIANAYGSNVTSTISETKTTTASLQIANGAETGFTIYPMIRLSNTSADYEPYSNICPISGFSALNVTLADGNMQTVDTATVNFGQTVYGGVADVTRGKVNVTHGIVDLGTLTWTKQTSVGGTKTYFRTASELADCKKNTNVGQLQGLICSNYAEDTWSHTVDTVGYDSMICTGWTNKSYIAINDQSKVSMSADDFKTAMSGVMLVYELATPIEITTTPENLTALSGQTNNVYGDTNGDTTVEYYIEV